MINLLIVDDEEQTKNRIKGNISWNSYDISVCDASNGAEALQLINHSKVDILLTDIRMPVMDGLELIETLSREKPDIKTIIMSGYDDFSYAQKALKLGTTDFLLKPSRSQEILDAVLKVVEQIKFEAERKELYGKLKRQFRESLPYMKEKYLNRLIRSDNKNIIETVQKLQLFDISLNSRYALVLVLRIDNRTVLYEKFNNEDFELMKFAVKNITEEVINSVFKCETFESNDDIVSIIELKEYPEMETVNTLVENIKENIKRYLGFSVSAGLGRVYREASSLNLSYSEALKALEIKVYKGEGKIVFYEDIIDEDIPEISYPIQKEKEILSLLKNGETTNHISAVQNFFKELKADISSKAIVLQSTLALFFSLYHFCVEKNLDTDEIFGQDFSIFHKILKAENTTQIQEMLLAILNEIHNTLARKISENVITDQIVKYIKKNYSKELNREIIAREVYITPGYLSILFKQELGTNFIEFLNKVRIEKACESLKDKNLKVSHIANQIGYNDEKYFFQVFKKYTGMTPSQYRESL